MTGVKRLQATLPSQQRIQTGMVNVTIPLNTQAGTATLSFPVAFNGTPVVQVTTLTTTVIAANVNSVSASGITVRAFWCDTAPATHAAAVIPVAWTAIAVT